jgi:hypothetical protein
MIIVRCDDSSKEAAIADAIATSGILERNGGGSVEFRSSYACEASSDAKSSSKSRSRGGKSRSKVDRGRP